MHTGRALCSIEKYEWVCSAGCTKFSGERRWALRWRRKRRTAHDLSWRRNTQNPFTPRPPLSNQCTCNRAGRSHPAGWGPRGSWSPGPQPPPPLRTRAAPGGGWAAGACSPAGHHPPLTLALCSHCLPRRDWLGAGSCERPSSYYYHHYCTTALLLPPLPLLLCQAPSHRRPTIPRLEAPALVLVSATYYGTTTH